MSGTPPKRWKLAVVASALNVDPRQAAKAARAAGFGALQMEARSPGLDLLDLSQSGRREFRSLLKSMELDLVGVRYDLGGKGFGPKADIDAALDRLEKIFETAAGLQSPLVCLDVGQLPVPEKVSKPKPAISQEQAGAILIDFPPLMTPSAPPPQEMTSAEKFDAVLANSVDSAMGELCRRADRFGVVVALRSDLSGFGAIERVLTVAGCPWLGVDLDPVALIRDEWSIDQVFDRLGGFIRHVRGRDAILGDDHRTKTVVMGFGSVDWRALLNNLDGAGFQGWISIDPSDLINRPAGALGGAETIRKIIAS